jgi:hypothetical protein
MIKMQCKQKRKSKKAKGNKAMKKLKAGQHG